MVIVSRGQSLRVIVGLGITNYIEKNFHSVVLTTLIGWIMDVASIYFGMTKSAIRRSLIKKTIQYYFNDEARNFHEVYVKPNDDNT